MAAVAHHYAFSHRPYIDYAAEQRNCCDSFLSMWDVSDVRADVVEHVRRVGKLFRQLSLSEVSSDWSLQNKLSDIFVTYMKNHKNIFSTQASQTDSTIHIPTY